MEKRHICLFVSLIFLFSLIGCNRAPEKKEEIINPVSNIIAEDLIEIRDSNLWLNQKELDKLSLDGEPYKLEDELLEKMSFSHVIIKYPLLVFNTNNVYNLEENELIFTAEDIVFSLEKSWGKTMGVNGVNPYGDTMELELEPDFFDFIDNVSLSPSKEKIAFSIHHYFLAMTCTITGVYDIEGNNIAFVEGPFMGQVQEISWSPDEKKIAYTSSSNIDEFEVEICVINSSNLKKEVSLKSTELFEEELSDKQLQENFYPRIKVHEWLDNNFLVIQLKFIDSKGNMRDEFIKRIMIGCESQSSLKQSPESLITIEDFKSLKGFFIDYKFSTEEKSNLFTIKGKYDLNKDGIKDVINLVLQKHSDTKVETYIEINGIKQEFYMDYTYDGKVSLIDLDRNDKFVEIAVFDEGPSADPNYTFYRYDGKEIYDIGNIGDFALINGDGKLLPKGYISDFEPTFYSAWLEIENNKFIQNINNIDEYLGKKYKLNGRDGVFFIPMEEMPQDFTPTWEDMREFETIELNLIDIYFPELPSGEKGMLYFWIGD